MPDITISPEEVAAILGSLDPKKARGPDHPCHMISTANTSDFSNEMNGATVLRSLSLPSRHPAIQYAGPLTWRLGAN